MTLNQDTGTWHVHLHVLLDVQWFDQADLHSLWRECLTGDPGGWVRIEGQEPRQVGGVNIKRLDSLAEAAKYVTKGVECLTDWPMERLKELVAWMRGRRLFQPFGCLFGLAMSEEETPRLEDTSDGLAVPVGVNARTGAWVHVGNCTWTDLRASPAVEDAVWARLALVHSVRQPGAPNAPPVPQEAPHAA